MANDVLNRLSDDWNGLREIVVYGFARSHNAILGNYIVIFPFRNETRGEQSWIMRLRLG